MPHTFRRRAGFTLIELIMVIAVISFLMAVLGLTLSKLKERTRMGQAKNLLEKVHNALEVYNLQFRTYPPATLGARTGDQTLYYFLATPFRTNPVAANGEVAATIDLGPLVKFEDGEMKTTGGFTGIIDPWGSPLHFEILMTGDAQGFQIPTPFIYSWGQNKQDNAGTGDDLTVGK
jgi:prepilin-type N-terminal cleavage/methylation domain-containing protein